MAIGLQGTWSVSVASKNAAWAQRFIIEGSSNGQDGGGWGVYGQQYTANGSALGGEFQINSTTAGHRRRAPA